MKTATPDAPDGAIEADRRYGMKFAGRGVRQIEVRKIALAGIMPSVLATHLKARAKGHDVTIDADDPLVLSLGDRVSCARTNSIELVRSCWPPAHRPRSSPLPNPCSEQAVHLLQKKK